MQATRNELVDGLPYLVLQVARCVEFATSSGTLTSREGDDTFRPGDAIVADALGRWVVDRAVFERTYEPAAGQAPGVRGLYRKTASDPVLARRLHLSARIERPDGAVHRGEPGDWIVWQPHHPHEARFVAHQAFAESYALRTVPVFVELAGTLSPAERERARALIVPLQERLAHTPIVCRDAVVPESPLVPRPWLRVTNAVVPQPGSDTLTITLDALEIDGERLLRRLAAELEGLREAVDLPTVLRFTWRRLSAVFTKALQAGAAEILASRLAAVEHFNRKLVTGPASASFLRRCHEAIGAVARQPAPAAPIVEPAGLERIWLIGAVADHWAGHYQGRWQKTVLATTREIASVAPDRTRRYRALPGLLARRSLVTFGLMATFAFATFAEWSGGCDAGRWFASIGCTAPGWKAGWEPLVYFGYLAALGVAWWRYASAKIERHESRHQDLRLLAECMRSRYVGGLLQVRRCVTAYLDEDPDGEAGWVHAALRSIHDAQPVVLPAAGLPDALARAQHDFVVDQMDYHERTLLAARRNAKAVLTSYGRIGFVAFLAAFLLMAYHQCAELFHVARPFAEWFVHFLTSAMVVSLAFWGAMRKVIDVHGLEAEIRRGERVLRSLRAAAAFPQERRRTVEALRVFIQDQARWHQLHRDKPIEAATGA